MIWTSLINSRGIVGMPMKKNWHMVSTEVWVASSIHIFQQINLIIHYNASFMLYCAITLIYTLASLQSGLWIMLHLPYLWSVFISIN